MYYQLKTLVMLAERRPYPPCENPWKYQAFEGDSHSDFSMTPALLAVTFGGGLLGWMGAKPIPLLPGWIGAVGTAACFGYVATIPDSRGDMLRFFGHSVSSATGALATAIDDVLLKEKTGIIFGHLLFFARGIDRKYDLLRRLQGIFNAAISQVTFLVHR